VTTKSKVSGYVLRATEVYSDMWTNETLERVTMGKRTSYLRISEGFNKLSTKITQGLENPETVVWTEDAN